MKISLYSSVAFKHPFGLKRAIEIAQSLGYDSVDVRGMSLDVPVIEERHINAVGYDMIGPGTLDSAGIEDLKKTLQETGIGLSGISCYNALTLPEGELAEDSMRRMREMIDFAAELRIPWMRLIGYSEKPFKGIELERNYAKRLFARRIRELCVYAQPLHVGILLENGENCIPNSSRDTLDVAEMVAHENLGIVYDVYNALFEGLDPIEELKLLQGRISCIHVKNARVQAAVGSEYTPKGGSSGFVWTLLNDGDVDYRSIFEELMSQRFDGTIVCEYANPYKGMSRSFWENMPDPYIWAKDAKEFLDNYVKEYSKKTG
ncbi:MAG TPA: sugar phosphate isomerase/epimerase family protein [Spirochaetales bacterium]|nr:sugar phosphate isomerase/epimerase family protein [Spirochaetales bacterium]